MRDDEKKLLKLSGLRVLKYLRLMPGAKRVELLRLAGFLVAVYEYTHGPRQDLVAFVDLREKWLQHKDLPMAQLLTQSDDTLNTRVVKNICQLKIAYQIDPEWIEVYLAAMERDIKPKKYRAMEDALSYMYGSAEVIGLMAAKVLGLPGETLHSASMQGRALRYVDILRSIPTDEFRGQRYIPTSELKEYGLRSLKEEAVREYPDRFRAFMHAQLRLYNIWQQQASRGMPLMPRQYKRAASALIDEYAWTARQLEKKPFIVYETRLEPSRLHRFMNTAIHYFD